MLIYQLFLQESNKENNRIYYNHVYFYLHGTQDNTSLRVIVVKLSVSDVLDFDILEDTVHKPVFHIGHNVQQFLECHDNNKIQYSW